MNAKQVFLVWLLPFIMAELIGFIIGFIVLPVYVKDIGEAFYSGIANIVTATLRFLALAYIAKKYNMDLKFAIYKPLPNMRERGIHTLIIVHNILRFA